MSFLEKIKKLKLSSFIKKKEKNAHEHSLDQSEGESFSSNKVTYQNPFTKNSLTQSLLLIGNKTKSFALKLNQPQFWQSHTGTYLRLIVIAISAYITADTTSLFIEPLLPEPPKVPERKITKKQNKGKTIEEYASILSRNIFSSKNLIPEDGSSGQARRTQLPLNLIGTVVLKDELKSIATIEDKSQNLTFPVRIDDIVNNQIKITKIERFRVYFINQSTGNTEYVEIVDDLPKLNITTSGQSSARLMSKDGITKTSDNKYEIEKNTLEKALSNIGEILQQARAIPNFENGVQDGFRLIQVQPNSIYQQLGLQEGDVINCVNGEPINDPSKAFQIFNEIRSITNLQLCIKRNGKKTVVNYDVR
jgi:general secretion pathway protein C